MLDNGWIVTIGDKFSAAPIDRVRVANREQAVSTVKAMLGAYMAEGDRLSFSPLLRDGKPGEAECVEILDSTCEPLDTMAVIRPDFSSL